MCDTMGEEMMLSDGVEDSTLILIHQIPQWQLSDDISSTPALIAPCSLEPADVCENSGSPLVLNVPQEKQQQPQMCLQVLDESLKTDLVVINKHNLLQQHQQEQNVVIVNDLQLNHLVDTIMTYSCRLCMFVAADVSQLLQHFSSAHCLALPQVVLGAVHDLPTESTLEQDPDNDKSMDQVPNNDKAPDQDQESDQLDNLVFMCGYCNSNFHSLDDCKQHMSQEHKALSAHGEEDATNEFMEACPISQAKKKQQREEIKKKLGVTAKEKKLRCPVPGCFRKFTIEDRLQLHVSCHVSLDGKCREFQCSKCDLRPRLEHWNQCALHLWHVHQLDVDLLSCPMCEQYKTVTQVKLTLHMEVHSDLKPYVCTVCNKGFKQSAQLRNHHVIHVDKKLSEPDLPRWYASQRCPICHKTYADSKCLKKHMKTVHSKLRPYVCQVCGHASAGKSMLRMHMRQHTGDKPYKCTEEDCEFRTGDHNSLRRHTMRHTGKRPYVCPHCPYSAIQSSAYKCHLRARHPNASELYTCSLCPYHTVNAESLAHHEVDHKHGLVSSRKTRATEDGDCEVFPGNVAAAHLIYRCFNPDTAGRGSTMKASLTGSQTSPDGSTQTIMIQIPAPGTDDDDNSHCFLEEEDGSMAVDTGGITIPADPEQPQDMDSTGMFPAFSMNVVDSSQVAAV